MRCAARLPEEKEAMQLSQARGRVGNQEIITQRLAASCNRLEAEVSRSLGVACPNFMPSSQFIVAPAGTNGMGPERRWNTPAKQHTLLES